MDADQSGSVQPEGQGEGASSNPIYAEYLDRITDPEARGIAEEGFKAFDASASKKFNEAAAQLPGVDIITISMDLPFAQKRWCGAFGVDNVKMLSDHKDGSFGSNYGTLIKELRIESRAIFVLDQNNTIRHAEYVKEVADHPNYESALGAARSAAGAAA